MKKSIAVLLTLALLMSAAAVLPVLAAGNDGMSFTADKVYRGYDPLSAAPLTIEATIQFPAGFSASERGGVICGNNNPDISES